MSDISGYTLGEVAAQVTQSELEPDFHADFQRLCQSLATDAAQPSLRRRRLFIATSWLPIGKTSSHLMLLLQVAAGFLDLGFEVHFVISGMEFTHHRGLTYYLEHDNKQLEEAQRAAFDATKRIPSYSLHFLTNSQSNHETLGAFLVHAGKQISDIGVSRDDIVLNVSGGLTCYLLPQVFRTWESRQLVLMMNHEDNVSRFSALVDYCIMPSDSVDGLRHRLISQGFAGDQLLGRMFPYEAPQWENDPEIRLTEEESRFVEDIVSDRPDFVLVTMSARLLRDGERDLLDAITRIGSKSSVIHAFIGVDEAELRGLYQDLGLKPSAIKALKWAHHPYLLLRHLAFRLRCAYYHPTGSAGAGAALLAGRAGMPVLISAESDGAAIVPPDAVFTSLEAADQDVVRMCSNEVHRVGRIGSHLVHQQWVSAQAAKFFQELAQSHLTPE